MNIQYYFRHFEPSLHRYNHYLKFELLQLTLAQSLNFVCSDYCNLKIQNNDNKLMSAYYNLCIYILF